MRKIFAKILMFVFAFALSFTFIACGEEEDNEPVKTELQSVIDGLLVADLDAVTSNKVLPSKVTVYEITWTLSESEFASIAKTRTGEPVMMVSSPSKAQDWQTLTLTASITSGDETVKKDFEVLLKPVDKLADSTVAEVLAAELNVAVATKGVVTMVVANKGIWVKDDTGSVYVYINGDCGDVLPGDEVSVSGTKTVYYSLVEIEKPSITVTKYVEGTFDVAALGTTSSISALVAADSSDNTKFGTIYNVEGTVITDVNSGGSYTYGLKDYKSADSITLYDSSMPDGMLDVLSGLKDKYVKITVMLWDYHSNGYFRFVPFAGTAVETAEPTISDAEKVAATKSLVEALAGEVTTDMTLPTTMEDYEGLTISWVSSDAAVLSNDGKIGTSTNTSEEVTLTATITLGTVVETAEVKVTIKFLEKSTIQEVTEGLDAGTVDKIWIEGKIIGFDKNGTRPFIADETGVIFSYTKLDTETYKLGDSVKIIGSAILYNNSGKEYTYEINSIASIEKLETEVQILAPAKLDITEIVGKKAADTTGYILSEEEIAETASSNYYGYLYEITGYVVAVASGSYTNYYLAADTTEGSPNVLYYYSSGFQTEIAEYVGKKVTIVAPMYNRFGQYGWSIGTYMSIEEKEGTADPTPLHTVAECRALAKDTDTSVLGVITGVYANNGFYVEDATGSIFVYVKGNTDAYLVGNTVLVTGKAGNYNGAQITSPVVTTVKYGAYTQNPVDISVDDFIALEAVDANYGAEYKITGKLVASGNYVNLELKAAEGETKAVTSNLYMTSEQKAILSEHVGETVTINVMTYNKSGTYPFNLIVLDTNITVTPAE